MYTGGEGSSLGSMICWTSSVHDLQTLLNEISLEIDLWFTARNDTRLPNQLRLWRYSDSVGPLWTVTVSPSARVRQGPIDWSRAIRCPSLVGSWKSICTRPLRCAADGGLLLKSAYRKRRGARTHAPGSAIMTEQVGPHHVIEGGTQVQGLSTLFSRSTMSSGAAALVKCEEPFATLFAKLPKHYQSSWTPSSDAILLFPFRLRISPPSTIHLTYLRDY